MSGLADFLLAKAAAAKVRRMPKDWYDIAFVFLHNSLGGPQQAADAVREMFAADLAGAVRTSLDDRFANFTSPRDQGPSAYAQQMHLDHPGLDLTTLAADAVLGVEAFHRGLFMGT